MARILAGTSIAAAILILVGTRWGAWRQPYAEPHAWVEAHFATMAADFASEGIVARGALPVQNHPPHGEPPDAYNHWPPLYPILLSWVYRAFGEGELQGRLFMALVLGLGALGAARLARACGGIGWLAALAWLCLPIQLETGLKLLHLHLALVATIWALALHFEGRRQWSRLLAVVAAASSWEPVLVFAALWPASRLFARDAADSQRRTAALALCAAGTAAVVVALFAAVRPDLFWSLGAAAGQRSGLDPEAMHQLTGHAFVDPDFQTREASILHSLRLWLARAWRGYGVALLALPAGLFVGGALRPAARVAFGSVLAAWAGWFLVFRNHATLHDYEMVLGVPAVTLSLGVVAGLPRFPRWAPAAVALILLAQAGWSAAGVRERCLETQTVVAVAREIRDRTPERSVVMLPWRSMLPVYYLERHAFRGVQSDATVEQALDAWRNLYPERPPLFVAVPARQRARFPETLARATLVTELEDHVLLRLQEGAVSHWKEPGGETGNRD